MAERRNDNGLKHLLIEKDLLSHIKSGRLAVGERLTTAYKIAEQYGVSRPTADKAIGNLAARGYVERTQGRGTFVTDWHDVPRNDGVANSILIIGANDDLPWCGPCLQDAIAEAETNGCHLALSAMGQGDECNLPVLIRNRQAAGTLVVGDLTVDQANVLFAEDLRHLIVGNLRHTFGQPSIRYDLGDAAYQITKKLLELDRGPVWLQVQSTVAVHYSREVLDGYQRAIMESPGESHHVHITRWGTEDRDSDVMARQIIADGQERFCLLGNYGYVCDVIEHLELMGMNMKPTVVALRSHAEREWPERDFVAECNISLSMLASEGVRQIVANAQNGAEVTGKSYKLEIETADDQIKPLRFSWR